MSLHKAVRCPRCKRESSKPSAMNEGWHGFCPAAWELEILGIGLFSWDLHKFDAWKMVVFHGGLGWFPSVKQPPTKQIQVFMDRHHLHKLRKVKKYPIFKWEPRKKSTENMGSHNRSPLYQIIYLFLGCDVRWTSLKIHTKNWKLWVGKSWFLQGNDV